MKGEYPAATIGKEAKHDPGSTGNGPGQHPDSKRDEVLFDIHQALGINSVEKVRTAKVFRFEGISENTAFFLANKLLAEDIFQSFRVNSKIIDDADFTVEVAYKPGVMNPEAASS